MKISIVVPTYNRATLIVESLKSIFAQSYQSWEVLIVDDGSTDNTREVLAPILASEPRVKYFYQENQGAQEARNFGISQATGDGVMFLDSDDLIHPEKIAKQVRVLKDNPALSGVVCQTAWFSRTPADARTVWNRIQLDNPFRNFLRHDPLWSTLAGLWRLDFIRQTGGWRRELLSSQDVEFHLYCAYHSDKVAFIPEVLAYAREHDGPRLTYIDRGQWIVDVVDINDRIFAQMKVDGRLTDEYAHIVAANYWWCGRKLARAGLHEQAVAAMEKAVAAEPKASTRKRASRLPRELMAKWASNRFLYYGLYALNLALGIEIRRYNWFQTQSIQNWVERSDDRVRGLLPSRPVDPLTPAPGLSEA